MYFSICAQPQCVMNFVNGKRYDVLWHLCAALVSGKRVNFEVYPMVYMYRKVCPDLERKIWEQMHAVDGVYHDTYIEHKLSDCHIFSWDINFEYIVFHKECALVYTLVTDLGQWFIFFFHTSLQAYILQDMCMCDYFWVTSMEQNNPAVLLKVYWAAITGWKNCYEISSTCLRLTRIKKMENIIISV